MSSASGEKPVASTAALDSNGNVRIDWATAPGQAYSILSVTNLAAAWVTISGQSAPFIASSNCLFHTVAIADTVRFFRVVEFDETAPENPDPDRLVWIIPGTFTMGSPSTEAGRWLDEGPQTVVTLTQGFFMGRCEVTQREYLAVTGTNPSYFTGGLDQPVEEVSWFDATNYCRLLTAQERAAGRLPGGWEYRLPTEAQWEYASRAGTTTPFGIGNGTSLGSAQGNIYGDFPYGGAPVGPFLARTTTVGSYIPNAWGLYDMHGNVWEWCLDWYAHSLPGGSVTNPTGPASGSHRLRRGGGWFDYGRECRSATRGRLSPGIRDYGFGFRVALVQVP